MKLEKFIWKKKKEVMIKNWLKTNDQSVWLNHGTLLLDVSGGSITEMEYNMQLVFYWCIITW